MADTLVRCRDQSCGEVLSWDELSHGQRICNACCERRTRTMARSMVVRLLAAMSPEKRAEYEAQPEVRILLDGYNDNTADN